MIGSSPGSRPRTPRIAPVPVIGLTGYLGAGKTSVLNHLLRSAARIGVVINDVGVENVDAALVSGYVGEPGAVAGGCLCCAPDSTALADALDRLSDPRTALDAIVVEASGVAEPGALARVVGAACGPRARPAGIVDVVDAVEHFDTVDRFTAPPRRHAATSLVIVNKLDRVPPSLRRDVLDRIEGRVQARNPRAVVVGAIRGRVDPALLLDTADIVVAQPFLWEAEDVAPPGAEPVDRHGHSRADVVTESPPGPVDPGRLARLLETPPAGVYRLKGILHVRAPARPTRFAVNVVGTNVQLAALRGREAACPDTLVAIGPRLDASAVRSSMRAALRASADRASAGQWARLRRYVERVPA